MRYIYIFGYVERYIDYAISWEFLGTSTEL